MTTSIRVYYHVSLINNYLDITTYVFDRIVSSGLHDECEGIFIGALGEESELEKLRELLKKYPKAQVVSHSTRLMNFEFETLRLLKHDADTLPKFYGVYTHSKSVTYGREGVSGKDYDNFLYDWWWMQYLCYWVVENWRKWYKALDLKEIGYDVATLRVIPLRMSASDTTHGSGNFFAVNSEYFKTLDNKYFEWSEWVDKFLAEMLCYKAQPIIYIMCNMFTQGFPFHQDFYEYMASFPNVEDYTI